MTAPHTYWRALCDAALHGSPEADPPLPAAPEVLAGALPKTRGSRLVLDSIALLWPLVQGGGPARGPMGAPLEGTPRPQAETAPLWEAILTDPEARHWREKQVALSQELLSLQLRHSPGPLPAWHLPSLLDLATREPAVWPPLEKVLAPAQRAFMALRPEWARLETPPLAPATDEHLEAVLLDRRQSIARRRQALSDLAAREESAFARRLARLPRHCLRVAGDSLDVQPLEPKLHRDWLPPEALPSLPTGVAPRQQYLERAYALLGLVPLERWTTASRGDRPNLHQLVSSSRHPEAMLHALGKSLRIFDSPRRVRDIVELYSIPGASPLLDELGLPACLSKGSGPSALPATDSSWLAKHVTSVAPITSRTTLLEVLLNLRPLPLVVFNPCVSAIFQGLREDIGQELLLTLALHRLALRVQPLPGAEDQAALAQLAAEALITSKAWPKVNSLLSFRSRMRDAFPKREMLPHGFTFKGSDEVKM